MATLIEKAVKYCVPCAGLVWWDLCRSIPTHPPPPPQVPIGSNQSHSAPLSTPSLTMPPTTVPSYHLIEEALTSEGTLAPVGSTRARLPPLGPLLFFLIEYWDRY
jgi:hypothetical protein